MAKRVKYGSSKVYWDDEIFDSKKEFRRWQELKLLEVAKEITNLRRQVKFELIPSQKDENGKLAERECSYYADFVYEKDGKTIVEDTKGYLTKEYIIKRKLMRFVHGIAIREI